MRGSKSKQLRRLATTMVQHGTTISILKPAAGQMISSPSRFVYQALKGRNHIVVHT